MKKVLVFIMKRVIDNIVNIEDFDKAISPLISNNETFYAYFYASKDKEGKSWCSDCSKANLIMDEIGKQTLSKEKNISIYNFPIENKEEFLTKDYFYRKHETVKLERIPTLIYFKKGKEIRRLVGHQLLDKSSIEEFFKLCKYITPKF